MFCGRVPVVFDYMGGDGMITPKNILEVMKHNFSGKRYRLNFDVKQLVHEIKKYKKEYGVRLRNLSLKYFDAEAQVEKLIKIYKNAVKSERNEKLKKDKTFFHVINIIKETRSYTHEGLRRMIDKKNVQLNNLNSQLDYLHTQLNNLNSQIQYLNSQLNEKNAQINQLSSQVQDFSSQLKQVINSRAHRIIIKTGQLRQKFLPKPIDLALKGLISLIVDGPKVTLAKMRDRDKGV